MATISEDEVHTILKNKFLSDNYKLLNYKLEPLTERVGYLSDHAILNVAVNRNSATGNQRTQEHTFFAKLFPTLQSQVDFIKETGVFTKEIFINENVFEKIKKNNIKILEQAIPVCYLTEHDRFIIFENLKEQHFQVIDKHKTFDHATALVVLKSLAKLHASVLIYEETKSKETGRAFRLGQEFPKAFAESFYIDEKGSRHAKGVDASVKGVLGLIDFFRYPSKLPSGKDFKSLARSCCYKIYELVKPSTKHRNVVCHGDLWSSNFLLKFDANNKPIACKFVDFQVARYCPPAQDVMAVLHLTTSREFRKKYMYELVGLYYATLEADLKLAECQVRSILPFSEFFESCEEQKLFAVVQALMYFQLVLLKEQALEKVFQDEELNERALFEDRSFLYLPYINEDEDYRKRLEDAVQDLWDYCETLFV